MKTFLAQLFNKKEKIHIEFCQNNLDRFLHDQAAPAFSRFLDQSGVQYREYECLSECKLCKNTAYAKVNGQIIKGENALDLLQKMEAIKNGPSH